MWVFYLLNFNLIKNTEKYYITVHTYMYMYILLYEHGYTKPWFIAFCEKFREFFKGRSDH